MGRFYGEDLAYVHHVGFGEFAQRAGEEILAMLHARHIDDGLVVDVGCGSGIWAARLLEAGYQVLGLDTSPGMLRLAESIAPQATFQQGSAYTFPLPPCQAITALGEVLGYGGDGLPDDTRLRDFFQQAASRLPRGGLLIFDLIVEDGGESLDYQGWRKGDDWAVLVGSAEHRRSGRLTREITIFREVEGYYRRSEECHQVRIFNPAMIRQLLDEAGFQVITDSRYGNYPLATRRLAFLASRA